MQDRYNSLLARAKKTPNDRAHSFGVIKNAMWSVVSTMAQQDAIIREEMALAPIEYLRIPPEDESDEQRADFKKKEKERISEALKKAKKKPKTDEEDAADM